MSPLIHELLGELGSHGVDERVGGVHRVDQLGWGVGRENDGLLAQMVVNLEARFTESAQG
ncbi:hypothetical protein [Streptosporangium sp. NPDC048865]|uniref:hypothetical protein n=1 Tax=Streptosporangium sp. NPDC048865 TaxID=3155766 RepID=UPI00342D7CDE